MLLPPRWTYAIAQDPVRPYRPNGPGRHSSPPGRPVDGVLWLVPRGFHWMGAFDPTIEPGRWGYRATLEGATLMATDDARTANPPALGWRAWDQASTRRARTRVVDAWYAWVCERWPVWRQRLTPPPNPPQLTIPATVEVHQASLPDFSVANRVCRESLVIGRPGDRGRWRPVGPAAWLPAGTWPAVVRFHSIAQRDGSWTREVQPIIETPPWPLTPLMLPGGPADLHVWAERLPAFVTANHGMSSQQFWTGCWNSLAGLPPLTGLWRMLPPPPAATVPRR